MTTTNSIVSILEKHNFTDLLARLTALDDNQRQLMIGVLGEFSSGKSTLINAMLGKKLLPALVKPTTARITEIYPVKGQEKQEFYLRDSSGNLRPVSALDFDDALLTAGSDIAIVKTVPNELMHDGYCIVDTPGLASLEDTHTDITFGYLPFIDGAIVCQDINKGGLTASLKSFLEKPEVRPFIGRIAFFLTLSDSKPPSAIADIRKHYCTELAEFLVRIGVEVEGLDERVLAVSSKAILDGQVSTENIAKIIQDTFVNPRQQIVADRITVEQRRIAGEAISRLHMMRDNLILDRAKYAERRSEINDELQRLEMDKKRVKRVLDEMHSALKEIVSGHLMPLKLVLPKQSTTEMSAAFATVSADLQIQVAALIKKRLGGDGEIQVQVNESQLQAALSKLDGFIDMGKTVGTAALAMALAAHGVPPQVLGTLPEAEPDMLEATDVAEGVMVASVVNMSKGSRLGDVIRQVNPIEWAGNFASRHFKEKEISQEINRLIAVVTTSIQDQLSEYTAMQLFDPAEKALMSAKIQLDILIAEEKQEDATLVSRRDEMANDILILSASYV